MKLVQTLVVRDEADIVDDQIAYHLNAGVDFVIASDHESADGTTEILERYARDGHLRRIPVEGEMRDGPWRTHMARLAATEHGADWVINTDADEFWMPRGGTLKEVLASVPETHGVVFALSRHFVPRPDDGASFAERMTVRVSPPAAIHDPTSPYRPHLKAAHRADPGDHDQLRLAHRLEPPLARAPQLASGRRPPLPVPLARAVGEQGLAPGTRRQAARPVRHRASRAWRAGGAPIASVALVVDDALLEQGLADGVAPCGHAASRRAAGAGGAEPSPTTIRPIAQSVVSDSVAVRDADIVRLRRHLDRVAVRVGTLEAD